jgi:DNA anti-recombination protein RmuC
VTTSDAKTRELKHRVLAKRKELEAQLERVRADAAAKQTEAATEIQQRLSELDAAISEGWEDMKDSTVERLNEWLRSA